MKEFKIRCSQIGKIIGTGKKHPLTQTAMSYCKFWLKEQLYERRMEFRSKYTDKGCIVEDESIDFIGEQLGLGFLIKNDKQFENDYFTGEPDILPPNLDLVIDAKNSWSWETFPILESEIPTTDYYWQLQGYMSLIGRNRAKLCYVLSDTPQHLIEREARRYCYDNGFEELDIDIYNKFLASMTYSEIPDNLKIKTFEIERNDEDIALAEKKVVECREYISTLLKQLQC